MTVANPAISVEQLRVAQAAIAKGAHVDAALASVGVRAGMSVLEAMGEGQPRAGAVTHRHELLAKGRVAARGKMNKTEATFAIDLELQRLTGLVLWWACEPCSFRLSQPPKAEPGEQGGQPARVTVDFMVLVVTREIEMIDVKGTGVDNEAQRVAMKCAAQQYPLFRWKIVKKQKQAAGGGWKVETL
jgi:hypothetical protein